MVVSFKGLVAGLSLMAFAAPALSTSPRDLRGLEAKLKQVSDYYIRYCQGVYPMPTNCKVAAERIQYLQNEITSVNRSLQNSLRGRAYETPLKASGSSRHHREYNEHVERMLRVREAIDQLKKRGVGPDDERMMALEAENSVLSMRLLRLQSRIKGAS